MRVAHFRERCALAYYLFQQRIVVEHVNRARILLQTLLKIREHATQSGFGEWVEKIEQCGFSGEREGCGVRADGFQRETPLRFVPVFLQIFQCDLM